MPAIGLPTERPFRLQITIRLVDVLLMEAGGGENVLVRVSTQTWLEYGLHQSQQLKTLSPAE
jgi:hypothetical protein